MKRTQPETKEKRKLKVSGVRCKRNEQVGFPQLPHNCHTIKVQLRHEARTTNIFGGKHDTAAEERSHALTTHNTSRHGSTPRRGKLYSIYRKPLKNKKVTYQKRPQTFPQTKHTNLPMNPKNHRIFYVRFIAPSSHTTMHPTKRATKKTSNDDTQAQTNEPARNKKAPPCTTR